MSRLDAHIAQKIAQRDGLDFAARRLAGRGGVIVEFGLGKGRSYSHLVERFPGREVFCFDRRDATHPGWGPPPDHLYLGEFADLLEDPAVHAAFAGRVLLAHLDLAFGESRDTRVHEFVVERIHPWLAPGGLLLSDRPLALRLVWGLARLQTDVAHAERFPVYERPAP